MVTSFFPHPRSLSGRARGEKMSAARLNTLWGGFNNFYKLGAGEVFAVFNDAGADDLAWQAKRDKYSAAFVASHGFAAVGEGGEGELDGFIHKKMIGASRLARPYNIILQCIRRARRAICPGHPSGFRPCGRCGWFCLSGRRSHWRVSCPAGR